MRKIGIQKTLIGPTSIVAVLLFVVFGCFSIFIAERNLAQQASSAKDEMKRTGRMVDETLQKQVENITESFQGEVTSITKLLNQRTANAIRWQQDRKAFEEEHLRNAIIVMGNSMAKLLAKDVIEIIVEEKLFLLHQKAYNVATTTPEVLGVTFYDKEGKPLTKEIAPPQGQEGQDFVFVEQELRLKRQVKGNVRILLSFAAVNQAMLEVEERIAREIEHLASENTKSSELLNARTKDVVKGLHKENTAVVTKITEGQDAFTLQTEQQKTALIRSAVIGTGVFVVMSIFFLLFTVSRSIAKPLKRVIHFVKMVSEGDVSETRNSQTIRVDGEREDEIGILVNALGDMGDRIHGVLKEIDGLIQAVQAGQLEIRGNAEAFSGGWRTLVVGVNNVIEAFVAPINVTAAYIDQLSKNDIPEQITEEYTGDFNKIKENLNILGGDISRVLHEMNGLIEAIQDGKLETRGNAAAFGGGWRELVVGVNNVIDAFVAPINVTAEYLDRIARGDIPAKITEEYTGDFNAIKNNLNQCIDAVNGLVDEAVRLTEAAVAGQLDTRGDADKFSGDYTRIVQGVNDTLDAVIGPLNVAAEYVDRISKGDIPDKITEEYTGDFNAIKHNLNRLIDAMDEVTRLAEAMAAGNLSVEVKERSSQDTLMQALNVMIQRLNGVVMDVKAAADNVASGSQAMSTGSAEMSQGAVEQAAAAEQAAASMEEMAANIRQNADNALQTEKIAMKAAEDAQESGTAVAQTVSSMQKIMKKISIIEEIARQTHMLSLNATIEAAKAEDYGKGFGVVASEVRALAERVQTAAVEINAITSDSIAVAEKAGAMLTTLVPDIQQTANLVQEISAASNEQSTGTEQINNAIQQLDNVIQQNSATSEELSATAEELASQAEMLQSTVAFFNTNDTGRDTRNEGRHAPGEARTTSTPAATSRKTDRTSGDGKPSGHPITMAQRNEKEDDLDEEFERY